MTTHSLEPKTPSRGAATYRIRVAGSLDGSWSERAEGMKVIVHSGTGEGRTTDLVGTLPDQAALMGILDTLYSHGARLLRVESLQPDEAAPDPTDLMGSTEER